MRNVWISKYALYESVNGHRKQQLSHTENQEDTVSFSNFIDARSTYNKRCMAVLTGALRTVKGNIIAQFYKRFYKLPYELGGTPFGQWARSAPGPAINQGTPRAPSNNLRNKTTCNSLQITQHLKHLSSGKAPPVHRSRTMSSP